MRQNVHFIAVLTLATMLLCSCKIDNQEDNAEQNPESEYFEDYSTNGGLWGFIDRTGARVISARYDLVSTFSEGLAPVNFEGRWGYIDKIGKVVIPFLYRGAWQFHNGIGRVMRFDGTPCLIFHDGNTICPKGVDEIGDFCQGMAVCASGGLYGYMDTTATLIIMPQYSRAWKFDQGVARVSTGDKEGLINKLGEFVIKPEYDRVYTPSNGRILVKIGDKYMFLNMNGDIVSGSYDQATAFVDSIAVVGDSDGWYLINLRYEPLFTTRYTHIRPAGQRMWVARQGSQLGVLAHYGDIITPFAYDQINNFSEGYAGYMRDGLWGFLDQDGNELTPPQYGLVWDFHDGLARAAFRDGIAFINTEAKIPFAPDYTDVRDFASGLAPFQE